MFVGCLSRMSATLNTRRRPPRRIHHRRTLRAAATAAAILTTVGLVSGPAAAASEVPVAIAVDPSAPFGRLPADFVGLSFEMRELSTDCTTGDCVANFAPGRGNLTELFRTLGPSNVRIAGNQLDRDTLWVPDGEAPPDPLPSWVQDTVTPRDISRLKSFLDATGWHAEVGINLAHYDARRAADEGRTLAATLGARLTGAECGNEPNHYASNHYRPAPYGFAEHRADWEACADAAGPLPYAAPDLSGPTSTATWFDQFAHAEHDRIRMLTVHNYTGAKTITDLLSPRIHDSELADAAPQLASAQAVGVPIRMDETNSAVGGGIAGVSDVYASALWAMDYSLVMAQAGFAGLNFHGGLGVCNAPLFNGKFQRYTPLCAANDADRRAGIFRAAPEYYGLYMASRLGAGTFLPVSVAGDHNVTAYAVHGDDGRTRIAVIEKDDTSAPPVPVRLSVGSRNGTAAVERLTGAALDSAAGIAVQGASVDASGRLRPRPADRVHVRRGTVSLRLPAGSAAIITLPGH
jgi:Glycosyl hydrolase family 79 C-terminal beta domain